jgi:hypothetical protein
MTETMEIRNNLKKAVPHLVAVAIFLFITILYFYPVLEGKVLNTNDGTVSRNSSKEISDFRARYNKEPLWTNSMFSGMPAYLISTRFTGNMMRYVNTFLLILRLPVASIFLTMAGFYILLLIFKVEWRLAIAGALVYGFSTYFFFILAAGHNTKAVAIAYMAPMIGGIYYSYRYNAIKGAMLTTFFLSLEIVANHPQITYYSFICIVILLIAEFIYSVKEKEISRFFKTSLIMIIPVVLAVGMNFGSLYTTYEYGKYSIRGKSDLVTANKNKTSGLDKDYATQWSYGIDETLTILIPNFKGGSSTPFDRNSETVTALRKNNAGQFINQFQTYWGTQPHTDGPVYVGAIVVFLFILGLVIVRGREKWWLLIATIISIMLAWGKNFMPLTSFFLDYFPGYNKFRAVTMILVIAEFCMPLLALLALRDIFNGTTSRKDYIKGLKIALGITGGLTLLFILFPGLAGTFISQNEVGQVPDWLSATLVSDRTSMLRKDAFRSLVLIIMAVAAISGFYYKKINKGSAILILALLFLFDMFLVDKRYLNADKFVKKSISQKLPPPSPADNYILRDKSYYRVLNLWVSPFNDASTSLYHKSIGGYHGAKMRRYNELIDSALIPDIYKFYSLSQVARQNNKEPGLEDLNKVLDQTTALGMLNTKYIILNPEGPPLINKNALGNAWFIEKPVFVENANAELSQVNKINPANEAVIDMKFKNLITQSLYPESPGDTVEFVSYKPDELVYKYSAGGERLVVFSEMYYPAGWKAFIDETENNYFRTDYVLRGMIVPGGAHEIRFVFKPESYYTGNKVSLASSVLFIILLAGFCFYPFKKK